MHLMKQSELKSCSKNGAQPLLPPRAGDARCSCVQCRFVPLGGAAVRALRPKAALPWAGAALGAALPLLPGGAGLGFEEGACFKAK